MPKAFPSEFRRDVVAVARKAEARLHQIAKAIKQWTASAGSSHPQFSAPNGRPTRESRGLEGREWAFRDLPGCCSVRRQPVREYPWSTPGDCLIGHAAGKANQRT
jgi:hypothetical protein